MSSANSDLIPIQGGVTAQEIVSLDLEAMAIAPVILRLIRVFMAIWSVFTTS